MTDKKSTSLSIDLYDKAHKLQYADKSFLRAIDLYLKLLKDHSETMEAGFAIAQIQNITNSIVPKDDLLNMQIDLVKRHLKTNP